MEKTLSDPPKESTNVLSSECHDSVEGKDVKDTSSSDHRCELCGTCFESRRGLSSHARYHLRQLGVALSNSSGAPIDLLSKLIAERGGALPKLKKKRVKQPKMTSTKLKKNVGPKLKIKISNLVKKKYALSSSTSKGSALLGQSQNIAVVKAHKSSLKRIAVSDLTSTLSTDKNVGSELGNASISTSLSSTTAKPLWAPQETDGPLNLATMMNSPLKDDVHVCELCGAWYETSQGLSSHARAHLRQIGVNFDSKAAPVEVLHDLIQCGNLPEKAGDVQLEGICTFEDHSSSSPSTSSSMSRNPPLLPLSLTGVARGVKKQSAPTKLLLSSKNLKFKSIPRSRNISSGGSEMMLLSAHLKSPPPTKKQKISTDFSNDLSFSEESESLLSMKQQKTLSRCPDVSRPLLFKKKYRLKSTHVSCEFCHEKFKRKQSLASHVRSHLRQMGIREWFVRGSPLATLREVMSRRGGPAGAFTVPEPSSLASSIQLHSIPKAITEPFSTPLSQKVPKAKKGSRTVFSKPKDEPVEVDISFLDALQTPSTSVASPVAFSPVKTQNTASKTEPAQLVCCNYCGEMFDTRKALSCHARSHLRQLGVKWSPNASPIITLYEFMKREGTANASEIKEEPSLAISVQSKNTTSPPGDNTSSGGEATCELCGFDFENRKALASHARAHLRQLQVDWKVNGSPIETLMAWMKSEPGKVAELHKRYMRGDLPLVKKGPRKTSSPGSFCESSHPGVQAARVSKDHVQHRKAGMSHFSSSYKKRHSTNHALLSDGLVHKPTAQSEFNIRSVRGCERRPPKHLSNKESIPGESGALKPHRTGSIPSLVPKPPEHSLVKMVGKVYFLKCRFCEEIFEGPLSIQEDWVMHLQQHILKLKKDSASSLQSSESTDTPLSSHPDAVPAIGLQTI